MQRSHRFQHQTRIGLTRLEDRLQPGSLLTFGLDLTAVEDMLPRPESDAQAIRKEKHQATEEVMVVAPVKPATLSQTPTFTARSAQSLASTNTPVANNAEALAATNGSAAKVFRPTSNPALYTPSVAAAMESSRR